MRSRLWPGLLLTALLPAATLPAQTVERPSHLPIPDPALEQNMRPEDALENRLGRARPRKELLDKIADPKMRAEIEKLAKKLMQDEQLMKSLQGKLRREDAERLLGKVGSGGGIGDDPELQRLLKQALQNAGVSDADKQKMRDWSDMLREKGFPVPADDPGAGRAGADEGAAPPEGAPGAMHPPRPAAPSMSPRPPVTPPQPKREDSPQEWAKKYLEKAVTSFDRWKDSPAGKSWLESFQGMARRLRENPIATPAVAERAARLTQYLPRFNRLLPHFRPPRLPEPYIPRLPSFGALPRVNFSAPRAPSGITPGRVLVWLVVLAAAAGVLWRAGGLVERVRQARAAAWRLGPWPVRPEDVATRGDLVRAFEHLALLCLGPDARTHHHLDLAARIGAQSDLDPERRQDAARHLAGLYEQARYTPDDERLADDDLHRARRELCYLAGVTAA
jgi:hypothetical protein